MTEAKRLPSLDLLLEVAQEERRQQLGHFDGLDTKAGTMLGFAGCPRCPGA